MPEGTHRHPVEDGFDLTIPGGIAKALQFEQAGDRRYMAKRFRMTFMSGGTECVGYLYRADDGPAQRPCLVMAWGFGGTQEGTLAAMATEFGEFGIPAFTFDYRSFGESGGEPRQVISIAGQLEDWRCAIAFVRGLAEVDPDKVALLGSSLGGGHVIVVAADDPKLAAVVAQIPFTFGFPRKVEGRTGAETRRLLGAAIRDWWRGRTGKPPLYIPTMGQQGELAVVASAEAVLTAQMMDNVTWRNEIAPRVLLDMAFWYRPGKRAKDIACPFLLTLAEYDEIGSATTTRRVAELAPRGELRRYPCNHLEFYHPHIRRVVVADQASFLRTQLFGIHGI